MKEKCYNRFLLLISFTSGLSIMAMEITASRILAPYFGTSLFVWTNIIGVVLIALSLGYYLGGKYADRHPKLKYLLAPILLSGLIFLIIPWIVKPLAVFVTIATVKLQTASLVIFIGSFAVTLILFAFPLMLLGMVSPFVIRLFETQKSHLGSVAGSIFAFSTVGSILGTFLPSLWLIPTIGTRMTMTIFAIALILVSGWGLMSKKKVHLALLIILLVIPVATINATSIKLDEDVIFEGESAYQYIQVTESDNGTRFLVFNEGGGLQSVYHPDIYLSGKYYDYYPPLLYLLDDEGQEQVAIIGLAGGTLSRELNYFFGDEIHVDGIEIDKTVIEIATEYFELEQPNMTIHNQDGHMFLKYTDNKYDLIVIDAYQNQLYIPWTMTTQEFWETVKDSLNEGGIVGININATTLDAELLQAISNTMASVFPHTYVTKVGGAGWNYMVTASDSPIDFDSFSEKEMNDELAVFARKIMRDTVEQIFDPQKTILTDDRAPVELMTDKMIFDYIVKEL